MSKNSLIPRKIRKFSILMGIASIMLLWLISMEENAWRLLIVFLLIYISEKQG